MNSLVPISSYPRYPKSKTLKLLKCGQDILTFINSQMDRLLQTTGPIYQCHLCLLHETRFLVIHRDKTLRIYECSKNNPTKMFRTINLGLFRSDLEMSICSCTNIYRYCSSSEGLAISKELYIC